MLLSAILTSFNDEAAATTALVSLGDLVLVTEVEAARLLHDETVGEYISGAARRFAQLASDEDWLQLLGALERSDDPAKSCLSSMLRWSLAREADDGAMSRQPQRCSCGHA